METNYLLTLLLSFFFSAIISQLFLFFYRRSIFKTKFYSRVQLHENDSTSSSFFSFFFTEGFLHIIDCVSIAFLWYSISLSLTMFNKWFLQSWKGGGFNFPFLITGVHLFIKYILSILWYHSSTNKYLKMFFNYILPDYEELYGKQKQTLSDYTVNEKINPDEEEDKVESLSWSTFFKTSFPIGAMTSMDIVLSNLSVSLLPLSLVTIFKGSTLIFTFFWGIVLGIEKFNFSLFLSVLFICGGLALTIIDQKSIVQSNDQQDESAEEPEEETNPVRFLLSNINHIINSYFINFYNEFDSNSSIDIQNHSIDTEDSYISRFLKSTSSNYSLGLICVFTACAAGGLRWSLIQYLQDADHHSKSVVITLYRFSPASFFTILPFSLTMDNKALKESGYLENEGYMIEALLLCAVGGLLAFFLLFVEIKLIRLTTSLTMSVFGQIKEIIQIILAMIIFHEQLGLISVLGLMISILGSIFYKLIVNKSHEELDEKTVNEIELVLSPLTNDDSINFYDDDDEDEIVFQKYKNNEP